MTTERPYPYDCHLIWDVISACNYNCDYCLAASNTIREKPQKVDARQVRKVLDASGKIYEINLVGGEPTLLPNFNDLIRTLTARHYLFLSTNLSRVKVLARMAGEIDPSHVTGIDASLHVEQREKRDGLASFAANVRLLKEAGFTVTANYVAHPRLLNRVSDDIRYMADRGVDLNPTPFIGFWEDRAYPDAYTAEQRDTLFNPEVYSGKWDASVDTGVQQQYCNAGYNVFWVARNGDVCRCTSFLGQTYGNIFTHIEPADQRMQICNASTCSCPYYSVLSHLFRRAKQECNLP